jgi:hypothetical protein
MGTHPPSGVSRIWGVLCNFPQLKSPYPWNRTAGPYDFFIKRL